MPERRNLHFVLENIVFALVFITCIKLSNYYMLIFFLWMRFLVCYIMFFAHVSFFVIVLVDQFFFLALFAGVVSGCLLPSLPSDAVLDQSSGISFVCDLNDNIPAPWPSLSHLPVSSCNKCMSDLLLLIISSDQSPFSCITNC